MTISNFKIHAISYPDLIAFVEHDNKIFTWKYGYIPTWVEPVQYIDVSMAITKHDFSASDLVFDTEEELNNFLSNKVLEYRTVDNIDHYKVFMENATTNSFNYLLNRIDVELLDKFYFEKALAHLNTIKSLERIDVMEMYGERIKEMIKICTELAKQQTNK